jgi:hypothetical protein
MKLYRSVSEKRTYRTISDEFISREFVAGQEIDIPDEASPTHRQYLELDLLYGLKVQVLTSFVLEGMITQADFEQALAPYKALRDAAHEAMVAATNPMVTA